MKTTVVANWKMNPSNWREAKRLFAATRKAAEHAPQVSLIVAPPTLYLRELRATYAGRKIAFAVQNAHEGTSGAYTGELSFAQCKDSGASYVLVGHAERREMGESNEETGKKVTAALQNSLVPVLCVGESQRSGSGEHFEFVRTQLRAGISAVEPQHIARVIVAYEPVWAIGAQKPMTPRDMHEMAIFIRKSIVDIKGEKGMAVKILYGGAIDDTSAPEMLKRGDVHGLLVGRASEDVHKISGLLAAIENA